MILVGLTGGIGSGKTVVCHVFRQLGVPVFNADDAARALYDTEPGIKEKMTCLFGKHIYSRGRLDRSMLSELIFRDSGLRERVSAIVHPAVRRDFLNWCAAHQQHRYVVLEAAILFESHAEDMVDRVITVLAPEKLRVKRLLTRTGMTRDRIRSIMDSQLPDEERISRSDYIVTNDDNTLVIPQVLRIHNELNG